MKRIAFSKDQISVSMSYEELYVISNCVCEVRENLHHTTLADIPGIKRDLLNSTETQLSFFKEEMDAEAAKSSNE